MLVGAVVGQTRRALHDAEAGRDPRHGSRRPPRRRCARARRRRASAGRPAGPRPRDGQLRAARRALSGARGTARGVRPRRRDGPAAARGRRRRGRDRQEPSRRRVREDVAAVVLEAACIPYGEGISFLPLRELAERAAALDNNAPELGELSNADAALAAARALCEHFTRTGPVVVVLDDVHWAVPTFLDLVEYVVRAVDGPLLVVSATRPELLEQRPAWGEAATTGRALASDAARRLVDALPEAEALDENARHDDPGGGRRCAALPRAARRTCGGGRPGQ